MALNILTILLLVFLPAISLFLVSRFQIFKKLSPVFICYATGIGLANTPGLILNGTLITGFYEAAVLFAIPMLLFSVKLKDWPKVARKSLLSFSLAVIAALAGCFIISFFFNDLPEVWNLSGMLVGIFVGGTANMQAVGVALGVSNTQFIQLNAAEVACCGIYLLFLVSIAQKLLAYILPVYSKPEIKEHPERISENIEALEDYNSVSPQGVFSNFIVTILIIGLALLCSYLVSGNFKNPTLIIICLTSFSLLASTIKKVNKLKSGYETAEYLLLIFCTGIGLMADFSLIVKDGLEILIYVTSILLLIFIIHLFLCYLFRIDTDNMIISSTATIFGPAFIGQVASSIKNKEIIFPGMVISMIGIAIANYLGIGMAYLLKYFLN